MAARVPVTTTRVGGASYIVHHGQTGLLMGPNDPDGLGAALTPRTATTLGVRARIGAVKRFIQGSDHSAVSFAVRGSVAARDLTEHGFATNATLCAVQRRAMR